MRTFLFFLLAFGLFFGSQTRAFAQAWGGKRCTACGASCTELSTFVLQESVRRGKDVKELLAVFGVDPKTAVSRMICRNLGFRKGGLRYGICRAASFTAISLLSGMTKTSLRNLKPGLFCVQSCQTLRFCPRK